MIFANYYSIVNNGGAGFFLCIYVVFRKFGPKILKILFENIASFPCRECQALSSDMRIIILLSIMKEE